ncbi:M24 family metallopeptidase [Candidatus Clavichlamydia salmonicola]|uniref:M24 family metallopeptidase n=1 Tax=Candidatus Clavichlamydia salmonicola TaxID=469812 RepID=UPI001890DD1F|nr:Xaa-Pro peptidase family protein [Candidatus Clavichlamydia salmonicola]
MKHPLEQARSILLEFSIDALLIDHESDIIYFTGVHTGGASLLLSAEHSILFVSKMDYELAKKSCSEPSISIVSLSDKTLSSFIKEHFTTIGFDIDHASYKKISLLDGAASFKPLNNPLKKIREIKTAQEIHFAQKAATLASEGLDYIIHSVLKTGITEKEVANKLASFLFDKGSDALAFPIIAAFGENSAFPHSSPSLRSLQAGDTILLDFGAVIGSYHSDMTRMFSWNYCSPEVNSTYTIVLEAMQKALSICTPGTTIADLDHIARDHIKNAGFGDQFIHGLGHGVGLEIHESPIINASSSDAHRTLFPGMIITIEPGIYIANQYGIRLEDMILITDAGHKNLTNRPLPSSMPILS